MLEEQKKHYDAAKELISIVKVLMQPEDIVKQYQDAAAEMKLAGDYEDAAVLEKEYRQKAVTAEAEGKESLYQKAKSRMDHAEKDVELMLAKQTFERVRGYKDADALIEECDRIIESMKKKSAARNWVATLIIIAIAAGLVFGMVRSGQKEAAQNSTETSQATEQETETN